MKEPINVLWSEHNYCYHGKCPDCNKWTTFHHAWQPDEYAETTKCKECGTILDVERWVNKNKV